MAKKGERGENVSAEQFITAYVKAKNLANSRNPSKH